MALTKIAAAGLTADLIDETKLADNSIDSEHYNDGSIDNAHLADDAVGVDELSATGTASSSTFLRGDNSWATPAGKTTEEVQDIVGAMFTGNTETNITATYEDGDGTIDLVSTDTNTQLSTEQVQDIVGGMFTGNTETNISATYEDSDGTIDLVSTDTNTTYSVGDGGLTTNDFTNADHTKLDGIAASANNYAISADLLDEDNMATNSATKVASQQSIKAYVDANSGGASADDCMYKNDLTISNAHTIAATEGAHSVGPITLSNTVTVNGRWVIS